MVAQFNKRESSMVAIYSIAHFLVDFACAFFMFHFISGTAEGYLCVLLYNFCAFAMQMPIGIIADKLNKNAGIAIIGLLFTGLANTLVIAPVAAVTVLGLGNAMFHIGGGLDVLNISGIKLGALGVFVSPGAFGVYLGTILGRSSGFPSKLVPLVLASAAFVILFHSKSQRDTYLKNSDFTLANIEPGDTLLAIASFFLVVCIRSFVGLALDFPWKGNAYLGIVLICSVVFGKTLGGFISDRFGSVETAVVSLGIASLLFCFPSTVVAGVAAVLLFNMTMPITLWALARIMPGAKGFAFGLLTFGIFIGFLPVYLGIRASASPWLFSILSLVSLGLLWIGLRCRGIATVQFAQNNELKETVTKHEMVLKSEQKPLEKL